MVGSTAIKSLKARWILDSRGNPTIEVDAHLEAGAWGRASAPSGSSTGAHEALELRDGDDTCFFGMGVENAVANVNGEIADALRGMTAVDQRSVDMRLVELDGTHNKGRLGANAILGVSLAVARAAAAARGVPLYSHMHTLAFGMDAEPHAYPMPVPMSNVFNAGKHGAGGLEFQEFMLHPTGASGFREGIRWIAESYQNLKRVLVRRYGPLVRNVGDEGGFSGPVDRLDDVLGAVVESMQGCGFTLKEEMGIALDPAASEFYDAGTRRYTVEGKELSSGEMVDLYKQLASKYPITSIEDGLAEDDWDGWEELTRALGDRLQLVGDDLFVTQVPRIEEGLRRHVANALLLKVNQVGTLTESIDAAMLCYRNDYGVVVSHRSGETEDTTIADLAVGLCCGQIKTGAPARGERTAKYNRLLRIEEELGDSARYPEGDFGGAYRAYMPAGSPG
jgi:enolase